MATATVDSSLSTTIHHHHRNRLHSDSLPLIDLRCLSQSELLALSLCSSSAYLRRLKNDTDFSTPKIDRSIFNESAGSRKQTFSRLRLAPRSNSQFSSSSSALILRGSTEQALDKEDLQIVSVLKSLFSADSQSNPSGNKNDNDLFSIPVQNDNNLVLVPVQYNEYLCLPSITHAELQNVPISGIDYCGGKEINQAIPVAIADSTSKKRKRGRPRKYESLQNVPISGIDYCGGKEINQAIPVSIADSTSHKRRRGRPRKDESVQNVPISDIDYCGGKEINQAIPVAIADSTSKKRKRGRPRKDESLVRNISNITNSYQMVVNENRETEIKAIVLHENVVEENKARAESVVVSNSGNMVDPYREELMRRTSGMQTEVELLGFLQGLEGEWVSVRKKRKIVDANVLGDMLPTGWKLMLCIKKQSGHVWLGCRRYISPDGHQFVSYKEVSSYLLSLCGLQDSGHSSFSHIDGNDWFIDKITPLNAADSRPKDERDRNELVCHSALPIASKPTEHGKQAAIGSTEEGQTWKRYKCHKCIRDFDEPDELLQHLISFHQRAQKRLKHGTSNLDVIIKNGKYECQFCNKPFEEKHRFNGHLGNHIKDYVKRVEASNGVATIQKRTVPAATGVHPNDSKFQELTGTSNNSVAITSKSNTNEDISSVVPCGNIKANISFKAYFGKEDILSSISNNKMEKMTEVPVVTAAAINVFSGAESGLSNKENPSFCRSSNEMGFEKCTSNGNYPLVRINLMVEQNQERGLGSSLLTSNGKEEKCAKENIKDGLLSSTIEANGINDGAVAGKGEQLSGFDKTCIVLGEVASNIKGQHNSEGCSFFPSSKGQKYSFKTNEFICDEMGNYGSNDLRVRSGSNDSLPVKDTLTTEETYRRCSDMPSWNEQLCFIKNNINDASLCRTKKPYQEKEYQNIQFTSYDRARSFGFKNNVAKISNGKLKVAKSDDVFSKNTSDIGSVNRIETNNWLERSSDSFVLAPSANEQTLAFKDNGLFNSITKERFTIDLNSKSSLHAPSCYAQTYDDDDNVNGVSCILEEHKNNKAKSSCDSWMNIGFVHVQPEQEASVVTSNVHESCSRNQQLFSVQDNISSTVDEEKQKSNSVESVLCPYNSEQQSSLNGVFTGTVQDEPRLKDLASPRMSNLALCTGRHNKLNENAIPELTRRTDEENNLLSGFTNTSSRLVSSSGCIPSYNVMADKGDNGLFSEKLDGVSGFKGLRSGIMENVAYKFVDSHSNESKDLASDVEVAQGFNSSIWREKASLSLFPKMASRHHLHPSVCVSCLNELNHETLGSDGQTGSMGLICAVCKVKLCGN